MNVCRCAKKADNITVYGLSAVGLYGSGTVFIESPAVDSTAMMSWCSERYIVILYGDDLVS